MKIRNLIILLGLLVSWESAFAQENETDSKVLSEEYLAVYKNKQPKELWQEYISTGVSTRTLAEETSSFQNPFFSWGIEEILRRELTPRVCGIFLSNVKYDSRAQDLVFRKCLEISYTPNDFYTLSTISSSLPEEYMEGFTDKVLENSLTNDDLYDLLFYVPLKYRSKIFFRMDLNNLSIQYACYMPEITDYSSSLMGNLCQNLKDARVLMDAKQSALHKIMQQ